MHDRTLNERRNASATRARNRHAAIERKFLRYGEGIVNSETDVVKPLSFRLKCVRQLTLAVERAHQLKKRIASVEIDESDRRCLEYLAMHHR